MERTNIYLRERQLELLRLAAERRGDSVAAVVREAVDAWLERHGVRRVGDDEWQRRFEQLLARRQRVAAESGAGYDEVAADVTQAVAEVRRARARGR